jgi:hypothetical protein
MVNDCTSLDKPAIAASRFATAPKTISICNAKKIMLILIDVEIGLPIKTN